MVSGPPLEGPVASGDNIAAWWEVAIPSWSLYGDYEKWRKGCEPHWKALGTVELKEVKHADLEKMAQG